MGAEHMRRIRRILIATSAITAALAVVAFTLHITGRLALAEVVIDGQPISAEAAADLGLRVGESVLSQNCELAAKVMCRRAGIGAAAVTIELPDRIVINTNQFTVTYVAHDEMTNRLFGLDDKLRVAELDNEQELPNGPTLLGLGKLTLYETPRDFRLATVIQELDRLKDQSTDWFNQVSVIDFTSDESLTVSFGRWNFVAFVTPDRFAESVDALCRLADGGELPVDQISEVDLRYDGLIVITGSSGEELRITS